jgi:pimeloyl-ACP methyl ester carboxylesterase
MFGTGRIRSTRFRFLFLIAATLSLLGAVLISQLASAHSSMSARAGTSRPTIVLVHGAWADASSWKGEIVALQSAGYKVVAPPNPLRGVAQDSAYLASFLSTIPGPIVLVGHSYGGVVISNAANGNANVKALVFVDAFIPDQGEVVAALAGSQSCLAGTATDPSQVFNFAQDPGLPVGDYDTYLKAEATSLYPGFAACFANGLSARQAAELQATQRPAALGAIGTPSGAPAWKTIPSWVLIGTQDHVITPDAQLAMANRVPNVHISRFDAGHLGLIAEPDDVVAVILKAVRATS